MNNHPFTIQRGVYATLHLKQGSGIGLFYGVVLSADNIGISLNTVHGVNDKGDEMKFSTESPEPLFIPLDSISFVKVWGV